METEENPNSISNPETLMEASPLRSPLRSQPRQTATSAPETQAVTSSLRSPLRSPPHQIPTSPPESEVETSPLRSPSLQKPVSKLETSPLRSPIRSQRQQKPISPQEFATEIPPENPSSTAILPIDRRIRFHPHEKQPITAPERPPISMPVNTLSQSPVIVVNRSVREEVSVVTKVDPRGEDGFSGGSVEDSGERRSSAVSSILWRQRREIMVKRAALGFRLCAVVFCLVSFSVMAADKTQGWAGDSFDRYKEYRYCISVTIIGFVYSGFQAYDLAYNFITGKHVIQHHLRYYFDFSMDQILTYLLISASSSAATRVDDWQSNWGKDEFTEMASAAVGMSFLAFTAFAISSLISGYNLCKHNY